MVIRELTDKKLLKLLLRYQCEQILFRIESFWKDDEREHESELDKVIDEAKGVIEDFEDKEHVLGRDNSMEARAEYRRTKTLLGVLKGFRYLRNLQNN